MKLMIAIPCDMDVIWDDETPYNVAWTNEAPEVGECLSMGGVRKWTILETRLFTHPLWQGALDVYISFCHPVSLQPPIRETWDDALASTDFPDLSIELAMDEACKTFLQFSVSFTGETPEIGSHLISPQPTNIPGRYVAEKSEYWIGDLDCFTPVEKSNIKQVFLTYCVNGPKPELVPA